MKKLSLAGRFVPILACFSLLGSAPATAAPIDVDWLGGAGVWSDSTKWSGGVVPNNSGATTYHARIDNGNPAVSNVGLDMAVRLDRLTLDSTLTVTSSPLTLNGPLANSGLLEIVGNADPVLTGGRLFIASDVAISGNGRLRLQGYGDGSVADGIVTEAAGVASPITLTNGAGHTISGLGTLLSAGHLSIVNAGLISTEAGGPLRLDADIRNTGTINAVFGSGLQVGGGTVARTINNAGGTIGADGGEFTLNNVTIQGGTLSTSGTGTAALGMTQATLDGSTQGTLTNNALIAVGQSELHVRGDIANNNGIQLVGSPAGSAPSLLIVDANTTLRKVAGTPGVGVLELQSGESDFQPGEEVTTVKAGSGIVTLTNAAGHTIRGTGVIAGVTGGVGLLVNNAGTIESSPPSEAMPRFGALMLDTDTTNTGTLKANLGSGLILGGGAVARTINNLGGMISADGGDVQLNNVTIQGGTLAASGAGAIRLGMSQATLDGVTHGTLTNNAVVVVGQSELHVRGDIANNGAIQLAGSPAGSAPSLLIVDANTTLRKMAGTPGVGVLELQSGESDFQPGEEVTTVKAGAGSGIVTLTNAAGHTIRGTGIIAGGTGGDRLLVNNAGTIESSPSGEAAPRLTGLILDADTRNTGTLNAALGSTLQLGEGAVARTINNAGGLISADGGEFLLHNVTIQGGTLSTSGTGTAGLVGNSQATLDGSTHGTLTNNAVLDVLGGELHVRGDIANNGGLRLLDSSQSPVAASLILDADTTLRKVAGTAGPGVLELAAQQIATVDAAGGGAFTLINAAGHTIKGAGLIGAGGGLALANAGTIHASESGRALTISVAHADFTTTGTLQVDAGSTLRAVHGYVQTAGTTLANGKLAALGPIEIQGGAVQGTGEIEGSITFSLGGKMAPGNSAGALTVTGDYTQLSSGEFEVEIGGTAAADYDRLIVTGIAMLDGLIDIDLLSGFMPGLGDEFLVMTHGFRTGLFSRFEGFTFASDRHFEIDYRGDGVYLRVVANAVPEPGTWLLLLAGALPLLASRRRRVTAPRSGYR